MVLQTSGRSSFNGMRKTLRVALANRAKADAASGEQLDGAIDVAALLESGHREVLRDRLVEIVGEHGAQTPDVFFDEFGDEMLRASRLSQV